MKEFIQMTETLAKVIEEIEKNRKNVGQFLRDSSSLTNLTLDEEVREEKIIIHIEPLNLDKIKIAGVDGGLVKKSFHGMDLMLLRAIGVVFSYDNKK